MEIKIIRFGRYHHAVSGRLLIDGQHVCDTLEQDTGSLPEGEYVMCRNKASALPYYIYSGKEDIGSGLEQKADCAKEQKSDCVPEEKNRKVFLSMGNGIHGWRRRCIIVASAFIWASSSAVRSITISFCPVSACSWSAIAPSW